jgi:hypothetical protein
MLRRPFPARHATGIAWLAAAFLVAVGVWTLGSVLQAQDSASPASAPDANDAAATARAEPVTPAIIAAWRAKVGELRAEVASIIAEQTMSAGPPPPSASRLRKLNDELATLEGQIARYDAAGGGARSSTQPGANETSSAPTSRRDNRVTATKLETERPESGAAAQIVPNHKFAPAVARAKVALKKIDAIKDYTSVIVKRERVGGKLLDYEYIYAKIRQEPFSVYLRFLGPATLRGREVIYVANQNNGNLVAHEPKRAKTVIGFLANQIGTASLPPTSVLAMQGNRYPITEIGISNLTKRLIEVGEADMHFTGADAKYFPNAKVEDRDCEAFVFLHPEKRDNFRFHRAEVFIDKELQLPIRYASYDWPAKSGDDPVLLETYTYTRLKLNVGLTDADFDTANPKYEFPR